ncbi:hypothetical protein [Bifidobacterium miconisargentati]|uniref:hypothetical protein n=1 Tax=Bifidobacterium miconisargentati TaxID=2834437 RepID=UPI001BDDA1F7|nr:hypothetical protein [Bifidobacterium miconisargentati]MBW3089588.1 hypothetical protein [Bifidobacterium miconisargentati]
MDYKTIRKRVEAGTARPVSDRQLLSVIACALLDIAESLDHITRLIEDGAANDGEER